MHGHRWSATHRNDSEVWTSSGLLLRVLGICGCASDKIPIETFSTPKILGFRFVFCAQGDGTILKPMRTKVALCLFGANIYFLMLNLCNGFCALNFGGLGICSSQKKKKTVCWYLGFFLSNWQHRIDQKLVPYCRAFYNNAHGLSVATVDGFTPVYFVHITISTRH